MKKKIDIRSECLTCAAQSPLGWNVGAAPAAGGTTAVAGGTSSAQFSVGTVVDSTSLTQPGSGAGAVSTGPVNSFTGAISFAACSSFSAWKEEISRVWLPWSKYSVKFFFLFLLYLLSEKISHKKPTEICFWIFYCN